MAQVIQENLSDEFLTEEGHKLFINVKRYNFYSVYKIQVLDPNGLELLHVVSWELYPMMQTMAAIYKQFNKTFELDILEEIIEEMNEVRRNHNEPIEPVGKH